MIKELALKTMATMTKPLYGRNLSRYPVLAKTFDFAFRQFQPGRAETAIIEGMRVQLPSPESDMAKMIAFSGQWEPFETKVFKENVKPGMVVVDCGANFGYYTLLASKLVGESGKVHAFEPSPVVFEILQANINNNLLTNVDEYNLAVWDCAKEVKFNIRDDKPGYDSVAEFEDFTRWTTVKCQALDNLLGHADFVKMDIQGAEPMALKGMQNLIDNSPNLKMMVEYAPEWISKAGHNPQEFLAELRRYFEIYVMENNKLIPANGIAVNNGVINLLCVRKC